MSHTLIQAEVVLACLAVTLAVLAPCSANGPKIDLGSALIVVAAKASPVELKAATMLKEEIAKRTGIGLKVTSDWPVEGTAIVVASRERLPAFSGGLGLPAAPAGKDGNAAAEGCVLAVDSKTRKAPTILAIGNDQRGTLFAVGLLLRRAEMREGRIEISASVNISTAPRYPMRAHQLGYRPKSNTYDAWDVAHFEQYIRDLIVFGMNSVEVLTALDPDDAVYGPLMPVDPWQMTTELSRLLDSYDLDVWLWLPLQRADVSKPADRKRTLEERDRLFASMPRLDQVNVPSGDPGDTPPDVLLPYLGELAAVLRKHHPKAGLWVSTQGFEPDERDYFYRYLQEKKPDWLTGVIYGPWARDTIEHMRQEVPAKYPVRDYPDITHCIRCQYPVPRWDQAFALTLNREPIMPRPRQYAHIHEVNAPFSCGFATYSDGVNDDVNKMIWSARGWDPGADVKQLMVEYGRYFVGPDFAEQVANGLLALEENWTKPLLKNEGVDKTLGLWQEMEQRAGPKTLANWRFQQGLYRAYYDAYVRQRLMHETEVEEQALGWLAEAPGIGPDAALQAARSALKRLDTGEVAPHLRQRIEELAGALFKSIGMQLSVRKYGASGIERGATQDSLDAPLNDRPWLEAEMDRLAPLDDEAKLAGILRMVRWEDAGPGGFYDDLGNATKEPHLVLEPGWAKDPGFVLSAQDEFGGPSDTRLSWECQGQTLYDAPLRVRYEKLDPNAQYVLRATYCGRFNTVMKLVADGQYVIHEAQGPTKLGEPMEFRIPRQATADGKLELAWTRVRGRGPQVAEVWLIRK